jgi:Pvc16 N-terminal domain
MSNALSIATVTAVIKNLLENGLVGDAIAASVGDVLVTALPPDRIQVGSDERAQINLFLYQVTQNRNVDWVSQEFRTRHRSINNNARATNPPLALDLHYLLTAYGAKDFQAEILLGYTMQMLHISPVITSEVVKNTLVNASQTNTAGVFSQALTGISVSNLAERIGQIKISPEFLNMEETSKIWSALQTHYRPSATYQASMVLIEKDRNDTECFDSMLSEPSIEQVTVPLSESQQKIVVGSTLVIRGKQLQGDITKVRLGNTNKFFVPFDIQSGQVSLLVPSDLHAGVQSVQVVHQKMARIEEANNLIESNVAAFVLHPKITVERLHVTSPQDVTSGQNNEGNLRSGEITVKVSPKIGKEQRVILLLNEISNENPVFYSFPIGARTEDTDTMSIVFKNVKLGIYLVRVIIDGAESELYKNKNGEYDSPNITITN